MASVVSVPLVKAVASDAMTYTGNSVNTKTVTIGGTVYTAVTTPGATANEYKVGASVTTSAQYLSECINASGTAANFGTATVANKDVVATYAAGVVSLTAKVAGFSVGGLYLGTDETNGAVGGATLNACTGTNGSGDLVAWKNAVNAVCDPKCAVRDALNELDANH